MTDPTKPASSLSEISHLFLSEIRQKQTQGAKRPSRIPPPAPLAEALRDPMLDITPEEFARVLKTELRPEQGEMPRARCVSAVLASHLADQQPEKIRQYARHLAAEVGRVGLIEVDAGEFRLTCFDSSASPPRATGSVEESNIVDGLDGRRMMQAIEELSFDIDRWLLSLPNPRTAEARELLRATPHWVLLCTGDHEGVVSSYRTLKGLADLGRPRLSLVVLDARGEGEAEAVFRKLDNVSRQFLACPLEAEPAVRLAPDVSEHVALHCRQSKDKTQPANIPQWKIVQDFLAGAMPPPPRMVPPPGVIASAQVEAPPAAAVNLWPVEESPAGVEPRSAGPALPPQESALSYINEVLDLPAHDQSDSAILGAVLKQGGDLVECPIKPPMCPSALLALSRDRRLTLLAVAGKGLNELRSIGLAFRWLSENRALIQMALPQFAIDAHALPAVRLLVDHADLAADVLSPLLQSGAVTVQAYRKLKWGARTGLLLEAA